MAVNLKPVNRKLIVQREEEKEVKKGGIIIPDTAKEKPQRGKVIAVADVKKDDDPMPVKAGDVILFGKYAGTEINVDDQEFLILNEDEILAIVQG
ncbi:MAG: molecular chaperone GroES [Desulfuromonas sp. SDB]|nr:MAG: molecular chaperone GroES [Candidatus Cloacimonas sp. SDB]KQC13125.1 MAG: molecular chaperone GroES [Desulfuromonas sp. SDB]